MLKALPLIFLVLSMGFAAELAGTLTGSLSLFLGLGLVSLGLLTGSSRVSRGMKLRLLPTAVVVILCGFLLLWVWPLGRDNRLFAFCALIAGADVAFRAFGRVRRELYPAAVAALSTALLFLLLRYSPPLWMLWRSVSLGLSRIAGAVAGGPLRLGPSYSGLDVTTFLAIVVLAVFAVRRDRRPGRLGLAFLYLASIWLAYLFVMTFFPNFETETQAREFAAPLGASVAAFLAPIIHRHVPWNMPLVLLIFQLPAVWIIAEGADARPVRVAPAGIRGLRWTAAAALSLLAAVAVLVVRTPERPVMTSADGRPTRVVLYSRGFHNWQQPTFEYIRPGAADAIATITLAVARGHFGLAPAAALADAGAAAGADETLAQFGTGGVLTSETETYGKYAAGMFGRLPVFLRHLGFAATLADTLEESTLAEARIVVVINPYHLISPDEHRAIWEFVRRGGGLLVVGEHTWLNEEKEDTLNHLLSPSDIRFNFDTANWQIGGWLHSYAFAADPVYHRTRGHLNNPGVGIGASLEVRAGAEPMLFGRRGFSDAGVVKPPETLAPGEKQVSFLGDRRYSPGEQLGDLVLVAEQRIGDGRVVVVADTTGFVNHLTVGSHRTIARIFARLASPAGSSWHLLRLIAAVVFFALACVFCALTPWRFVMVPVLVSLISGFGVHLCESRRAVPLELIPRGRIAYIDGSHAEKYSRDSWRDDALAGLQLNLMRNGVQPLRMDVFSEERLAHAKMLFIVAPTRRYTAREVDVVERFINRGGYVVVSAGADSADAVAPLISRFDLRVRNQPLGPFTTRVPRTNETVRMRVAYTVSDLLRRKQDVLAWSWLGTPETNAVMIERLMPDPGETTRGRGGLLVIGDGQFFLNKNLESGEVKPIMENVRFLRWLIRHVDELQHGERQP